MNFEMYAKVKMSRPIDAKKDVLSAGGYSIMSKHKIFRFDFVEYLINVDDFDASIIHISARYPDIDTFPVMSEITAEVLSSITNITEFFIYTGEPDEDGAIPTELLECEFEISATGEKIAVPEEVCRGAYITRGF